MGSQQNRVRIKGAYFVPDLDSCIALGTIISVMDGQTPVSSSMGVHERAINGKEPSSEYIVKPGGLGAAVNYDAPIPLIDFRILMSSARKEREEEMEKLRSALTSWGMFQAIGHGISTSLLETVNKVGKEFFKLPIEEKIRVSHVTVSKEVEDDGKLKDPQGYAGDISMKDEALDWCDRLALVLRPQRQLKIWPKKPNSFKEVFGEYGTMSSILADNILKAMAELLGFEEGRFMTSEFRARERAMFNYYPFCSKPDLVYGVKPHSDIGWMTILLQDKEVEGLQILKDGQWFKVSSIPNALTVNVGDLMEVLSNGIFRSPVHRVVTNSKKERLSLAILYSPSFDHEVEPIAELVTEDKLRLYRKVNLKDYFQLSYGNYSLEEGTLGWAKQ